MHWYSITANLPTPLSIARVYNPLNSLCISLRFKDLYSSQQISKIREGEKVIKPYRTIVKSVRYGLVVSSLLEAVSTLKSPDQQLCLLVLTSLLFFTDTWLPRESSNELNVWNERRKARHAFTLKCLWLLLTFLALTKQSRIVQCTDRGGHIEKTGNPERSYFIATSWQSDYVRWLNTSHHS